MGKVLVVPSPGRDHSPRLAEMCRRWADEVGLGLAERAGEADAVVLGPGARRPATNALVVEAAEGRGVDGFRWAIRHAAFELQWPATVTPYGSDPEHVADIREGGGGNVAVLLHGGFWLEPWRRDLMDGIAVDLAIRGWTTVNAEYRRVGAGGGWPQTANDVLASVRSAATVGSTNVTVIGHSAGGHLALLAAAALGPEVVSRVVCLNGICDLARAKELHVGGGAVDTFLGGAPVEDADPMRMVPLGVPLTVAHASADPLVPPEQSTRFTLAALAAGDTVDFLDIDSADHFALIDPATDWRPVRQTLP